MYLYQGWHESRVNDKLTFSLLHRKGMIVCLENMHYTESGIKKFNYPNENGWGPNRMKYKDIKRKTK